MQTWQKIFTALTGKINLEKKRENLKKKEKTKTKQKNIVYGVKQELCCKISIVF